MPFPIPRSICRVSAMTATMAEWWHLVVARLDRPSTRWVALALVAAAIVATAVQSYREIDRELTAVALLRREAIARLAATMLAEKFGRAVDTAIALATRVRFRELIADGRWIEAMQIMRSVPRDLPYIERLFLADTNGTLRADVPALAGARGVNFSSRDWFQGVKREWRPYVSPVYKRTAKPQLNVLAVAVPVRDNGGDVRAILVLQIRAENLLEWVGSVAVGPQELLYIVDSKDQLAFHSQRRDRGEIVDMSKAAIVQKLRQTQNGVEIGFDPAEHDKTIMAYATVPEYGWGIVTHQPAHASTALVARDEQLRRLVTGYVLILVLGGAAIFLAAHVARERRHAEQRFRAVAETANDAVVTADSQGNIVYVNPAMERIFGCAAAEVLGQPLTQLMPERFHDAHREGLHRFLRGGEARVIGKTVELVAKRQDGSEFPIELSLASWKSAEGSYFTGILRDVTERKAAQEQLHGYAAQLETANKELEAFSYSVSHDLRAPLRSIDGFSQALLEDCAERIDGPGRQHLARIRAATARMGELIDNLLQLSRVTRAEMIREAVDLSALADSIVDDLRRADPERPVEVVIQPGLHVEGDAKLLRIALVNLLSNAWKFTGRQPAARIELGTVTSDGEAAYYVRDNGAGFDMAYVSKLFGAFQRLHAASEFPGTGVGLAIVQRIVHRHGGRVWAEGAVGRGATFYFTLPSHRYV